MKKTGYGEDYYLEASFEEEWAKSRYNKEKRRSKRSKNLEYSKKRGHKNRDYNDDYDDEYYGY